MEFQFLENRYNFVEAVRTAFDDIKIPVYFCS